MIDPIILKGFRDSMPKEEMPKRKITETLEKGFQAYGFVPIDTPPFFLEKAAEKQISRSSTLKTTAAGKSPCVSISQFLLPDLWRHTPQSLPFPSSVTI